MARFDLSDAEWAIIARLLPGADGKKNGRPRDDDRKVLNGIFFVLRTGSPWRDLPERYGPYTTVYNRFNRWAKRGIWVGVFEALSAKSPSRSTDRQLDHPRPPARRRRKKGGPDNAIGRSRGGLSAKINAAVDENGLPVRLILSPVRLPTTWRRRLWKGSRPPHVVADRGYDASALLELMEGRGGQAQIPTCQPQSPPLRQPALYRKRNLVEQFFCKLKHFRRIATRFDKTASNFLAAVALAATRLWACLVTT